MTTTHADESAVVRPVPPRYWWLKRIMIGTGVLLLAVLALRLWWGWEAHRRFQAEIDKLITAGEPIFPEDFNPKEAIPDEQNAAILYRKAAKLISLNDDDRENVNELSNSTSWTQEDLQSARRIMDSNSACLGLLREARSLTQVDWGTRFHSPLALQLSAIAFEDHRLLWRLASIRAESFHRQLDDAAAVEVLWDIMAHAEMIHRDPLLISHLVAMSGYAVVVNRIETIAPALSIEGVSPRGNDVRPAPKHQVQKLVNVLSYERPLQQSLIRCAKCERMQAINMALLLNQGNPTVTDLKFGKVPRFVPWWKRTTDWPFSPRHLIDGINMIKAANEVVDAAGAVDWTSIEACFRDREADLTALDKWIRPLTLLTRGSWERSFYLHFRLLAVRRMAATALAIRLYEVDHGRRPETLDELVPDYLPAVPLDPLAEGDRPIGYLPHAKRPILYSVGENGIDNGGRYDYYEDCSVDRRKFDWPFFLDGPPERVMPRSDAEADESDER